MRIGGGVALHMTAVLLAGACGGGGSPAPARPEVEARVEVEEAAPCERAAACCRAALAANALPDTTDCATLATMDEGECGRAVSGMRTMLSLRGSVPPVCGSPAAPGPRCAQAAECCRVQVNDPAHDHRCAVFSEMDELACEEELVIQRGALAMEQTPIPPACGEAAAGACERALACCHAHRRLVHMAPEDCPALFGPSRSGAACESATLEARRELAEQGHAVPPECGGPATSGP